MPGLRLQCALWPWRRQPVAVAVAVAEGRHGKFSSTSRSPHPQRQNPRPLPLLWRSYRGSTAGRVKQPAQVALSDIQSPKMVLVPHLVGTAIPDHGRRSRAIDAACYVY